MRSLLLILLIFIFSPYSAFCDSTRSSTIETQAQQLFDTTMSPYCPGRTLSACPSPSARDLRTQILTWLRLGQTPDEVRAQLLTTYGDEVRGIPSGKGFGLAAWIVPGLFVLLGVSILVLKARKADEIKGKVKGEAIVVPRGPSADSRAGQNRGDEFQREIERAVKERLVG